MTRNPLVTAALALLLACSDKVPKPASDASPPTLRWRVLNNNTNVVQEVLNGGTIHGTYPGSYNVMLFAEDPQGVHSVSLASSVGWTCTNGNLVKGSGPGLGVPDKQVLQPDNQGKVLTKAFRVQVLNFAFDCQAGYVFSNATLTFYGIGENYFNGTTQGQLVMNVP